MYEQYVILYYIDWAHLSAMYAPPLRYKREALAAHYKLFKISQTLTRLREEERTHTCSQALGAQAIQHTVDVGYYASAARTTLNAGVHCVLDRDRTKPSYPSSSYSLRT